MATSLSELIAQKDALERQIRDARSTAKVDAIERVRKLMSEHGLTAADLVATATKSKVGAKHGAKVEPKYRDPVSGTTWSGRGLKPRWLATAIEGGKALSDFAI